MDCCSDSAQKDSEGPNLKFHGEHAYLFRCLNTIAKYQSDEVPPWLVKQFVSYVVGKIKN